MIVWTGEPGFNGMNFPSYRNPITGKQVIWKDEFDNDKLDGFFIKGANTFITTEGDRPTPRGEEIIKYLEQHPFLTAYRWFIIRDLNHEEKTRTSKVKSKRITLQKLFGMSEEDLRTTLISGRIDASGTLEDMQNRIQYMADTGESGVAKLFDALEVQDKEYRVAIAMGISKSIIFYDRGKYRMGGSQGAIIGYDEDQVIMFMKENPEDYEYLKKAIGSITSEKANEAITHIEQKTSNAIRPKGTAITSAADAQQKLADIRKGVEKVYTEPSEAEMLAKAQSLANM